MPTRSHILLGTAIRAPVSCLLLNHSRPLHILNKNCKYNIRKRCPSSPIPDDLDAQPDRCVGVDQLLLHVDVRVRIGGVDEGHPDLEHALLVVKLPLLDQADKLAVDDPLAEFEGVRRRPVAVGGDDVCKKDGTIRKGAFLSLTN